MRSSPITEISRSHHQKLAQLLALNDDLNRVLDAHDRAIAESLSAAPQNNIPVATQPAAKAPSVQQSRDLIDFSDDVSPSNDGWKSKLWFTLLFC